MLHFERTLRQELGIAPAPQSQEALLVALEQQRADQQHALPSTAFAPSTAFRLPFVGRDALLAQLQDIAQAVATGRGACGASLTLPPLTVAALAGLLAGLGWPRRLNYWRPGSSRARPAILLS